MTYQAKDLSWGSYGDTEGWYTYGPAAPPPVDPSGSNEEAYLRIVCQTESPRGGCPGAINAFDSCKISVGYLQLCQTYFLTTDLLGYLVSRDVEFTPSLKKAFEVSGCDFRKDTRGRWRLFRGNDAVDTPDENNEVFFGGVSGKRGSWDEASKERAKIWVLGLQEYLIQPAAIDLQVAYLRPRLTSFVTKKAYARLWGEGTPEKEAKGWPMAVRSAFLSFSANNPTLAERNLSKVGREDIFSQDGAIEVIKSLTFSEGNPVIYPKRYEDIRPSIEVYAKVDLPDTRKDLEAWGLNLTGQKDAAPSMVSVQEIQQKLLHLGYDLGPKGADGVWGQKTRAAVITFQRLAKLHPDGIVGPKTRKALIEAA